MYRTREGRLRKLTVGTSGKLTPDEARNEARQRLAEVERGGGAAYDDLVGQPQRQKQSWRNPTVKIPATCYTRLDVYKEIYHCVMARGL